MRFLTFALTLFACLPALAQTPDSINLRKTVVVDVVARTKGAVVNISTTKLVHVNPFGDNPMFQQFDLGATVRANTLGSGFLVHDDGYVITNNHVIDAAREIIVELDDGRKLKAALISADPEADLAVLKVDDPKPFPTLQLGDSDDLMIGEPAIAIGNPLGYSHSVSTGIISAVHRDLQTAQGKSSMRNLIQTDAAINPGNSGGPLLNAYGQVIAINTAIRSDAQNIGFAIPINRLRDLIPELLNPSIVKKLDVPIKLSEQRKITPPADIHVDIVTADDPPRIVKDIDGHHPRNIVDAFDLLLHAKINQPVHITFQTGPDVSITPKPAPLPDAVVAAKKRLGITVEALTPMLAQKYGLNIDEGMFISAVANNSVAATSGINPGDVLMRLGQFNVTSLDDLAVLLQHMPNTGRVAFTINRDGERGIGYFDMGAAPPNGATKE